MTDASTSDALCWLPARQLAADLKTGVVSAREVLAAHVAQIERVDGALNAIPTTVFELAEAAANAADELVAKGEPTGTLHGLPIAHKDLHHTKGIRTTMGSPVFADHVPDFDELLIERMRTAGAITVGKTNTPEFGAGSQTFNEVFGATRNPYDVDRTCGGSSGGAAVALATGMVPLADGSDLGGSLRNPANFCNVVGLRPTPGRVPSWPAAHAWSQMSVQGPMARTVDDLAFFLGALAGPDPRVPISLSEPGSEFSTIAPGLPDGLRIAWSPRLGDLPVDPAVLAVLEPAMAQVAAAGIAVEAAEPDLTDADVVFQTLRAFQFELGLGALIDERRDEFKATLIGNVEVGRALSGPDVGRAIRLHGDLQARFREFQSDYPILALPVSQVVPFGHDVEYPTEIDGEPMGFYLEWMRSCSRITTTGCPAISIPCGFTPEGLPVGLQLVGAARQESELLRVASALEAIFDAGSRRPEMAL